MNYTQNKEQDAILNYFGDHIGTFLDLGANNGITFSNTRALAERGWKGVLIEPAPTSFAQLKELYKDNKGIYTYNYAISDRNGNKVLLTSGTLLKNGDVELVSTFHPSEMERFKSVVTYNPVDVKCFTWNTARNRWKIKQFDMISIDVEGSEMEILPHMDLSEVKMLVIEWNGKPELKTEYEKHLDGFKLIYTSGENLIYVR